MASSSFLDRISNHRARSPVLPLHNPSISRSPSEYQMNELSPRPDDASSAPSDGLPTAWIDEQDALGSSPPPRRSPPPSSSWRGRTSPPASPSRSSSMKKPWTMFSGPPPPISASMVMSRNNRRQSQKASRSLSNGANALQGSMRGFVPLVGSVFFDPRPEPAHPRPDSRWRGLQRQGKALEQEVQKLLDAQAAALSAGSGGVNDALGNDSDVLSDGSSTPTGNGTVYSTKSAKSHMRASLYVPTRATADGNVIPVRQPTKDRPLGLRATRTGLRKSITAMTRLKDEESAYLDAALAQRTEALEYLNNLSARKADIDTELKDLDQGEEEPLGQELRELTEKHSTLDREIKRLEDQLAAMRDRRRWLEDKMENIRNKREAGLSGYRGALKEVDAEVAALVQRPPVQPLDPEILCLAESSGGAEFLQLNPARRTLEMARSWWESEAAALRNRKTRIDADRQALEEGGAVWELVMQLVSDFESRLRRVMKSSSLSPMSPSSSASASASTTKGKEKMPPQEETIRDQLPRMKNVMEELERHMSLAQEHSWNLLICAIGAEAEAFREAYNVLEAFVGPSGDDPHGGGGERPPGDVEAEAEAEAEETDNEVPQDLLGPPAGDGLDERDLHVSPQGDKVPLNRAESDSENEVPLEFLSEDLSP